MSRSFVPVPSTEASQLIGYRRSLLREENRLTRSDVAPDVVELMDIESEITTATDRP